MIGATWMILKNVMLNKRSNIQNSAYSIIILEFEQAKLTYGEKENHSSGWLEENSLKGGVWVKVIFYILIKVDYTSVYTG